MAKGRKTGGRKKGTPNKLTRDVQEFVERIFEAVDPVEITVELLTKCKSEKVQGMVLLRLLEYRYGRPRYELAVDGRLEGRVTLAQVLEARRRAEMEKPNRPEVGQNC
jgi:hypothetical protein